MAQRTQSPERIHRREVRRMLMLPFFGALLLLIVLVIIAAQTVRPGVIADILLTLLILCPLAICLLPLYLGAFLLMGGVGRLHNGLVSPFKRLRGLTAAARERAEDGMDRAACASIGFNVRFAWLDRLVFSIFDGPTPPTSMTKTDIKPVSGNTSTDGSKHDGAAP